MASLNKLRQLDDTSVGVTIPKDDLRLEGLIEDGKVIEDEFVKVEKVGDGEWKVERVDGLPS